MIIDMRKMLFSWKHMYRKLTLNGRVLILFYFYLQNLYVTFYKINSVKQTKKKECICTSTATVAYRLGT